MCEIIVSNDLSFPEVNCGVPDENPNTTVDVLANDFEALANYSCNPGYEQSGGSTVRICGANGNWTGRALECQSKFGHLSSFWNIVP